MVEEDLKQHEDDWDDFAEAVHDGSTSSASFINDSSKMTSSQSVAPIVLNEFVGSSSLSDHDCTQMRDLFDLSEPNVAIALTNTLQDGSTSKPTVALHHIPLSVTDLEALAITLAKSCHYEYAYNCVQQRNELKALMELSELKLAAVERDDLITATRLKGDIDRLTAKLFSWEEEVKWIAQSKAVSSRGETMDDATAAVSAIDQTLGARFRAKFIPAATTDMSVVAKLRLFTIARRYSRMIQLSRSSAYRHFSHDWLQVLRVVSSKMMEGRDCIARYLQFNDMDREHVRRAPKFITYGRSLIAFAEVGMWVSASCLESMCNEQLASDVFQQCRDVIGQVGETWDLPSKVRSLAACSSALPYVTLPELSVRAVRWLFVR